MTLTRPTLARLIAVASVAWAVTQTPALAKDGGFSDLFDGKTLTGWTQRNGTAKYKVVDGTIHGVTNEGSPNSFLCTDKEYGNFELLFDVKVHDKLNSGVQIRSQTKDGPTGRVNGPQVEIEASGPNGAEAGYLYGEAAGGWMTPEKDRAPHKHFKDGQWNSYRVVADGANIKVWINGNQVSDLTDEEKLKTHPKGFIGLQVHGIGKKAGPFDVAWRNIKIRELSNASDRHKSADADGWKTLYNGKDLSGWNTTGNWIVQDDGSVLIQPRAGEKGWQRYDAYLWSDRTYKDFVLDVEYAYPPKGNSGVYFRVKDTNDPVATGIEAQILDNFGKKGPMTAHDHGGIVKTAPATKNMSKPPHEWNRMVITCKGHHLGVELNGEPIIHVHLDNSAMKDRPLEGYIGFQDHGEPNNIKFRNIRIKELD